MGKSKFFKLISTTIYTYSTAKEVEIKSKKVGSIYRVLQLMLAVYFAVYVLYYGKGYQAFDTALSGVVAKVKGVSVVTPFSDDPGKDRLAMQKWVFDDSDYIIPPQQNAAFFVATKFRVTKEQSLGVCPDNPNKNGNLCQVDADCVKGEVDNFGHGEKTGRCVPPMDTANGTKVCEIYGWCPVERMENSPELIQLFMTNAPNYTVLLKNSIEFPKYKVKRRNILPWMTGDFLNACHYNPHDEKLKFCPIFRLKDILHHSEDYDKRIWISGGMVSITISWQCNLDRSEDHCVPAYSFKHLDKFTNPIAKGWNFRYADHYRENGVAKRTLYKAYGIQFFVSVYGIAGKFEFLTFTMNLGSLIGLLGFATFICDIIILQILSKRKVYDAAKTEVIGKKPKRKTEKTEKEKKAQVQIEVEECLKDVDVA